MNKVFFLLAMLVPFMVQAEQCQLIHGKIAKIPHNPIFRFTKAKKYSNNNYPMTHTQFFIHADDGKTYKIIVDNLFYNFLSPQQLSSNYDVGIITDFNKRFKVGDDVTACGRSFDKDGKYGLHFVHPSGCETTKFNGFLRINGSNLTNNVKYCMNCNCKTSK